MIYIGIDLGGTNIAVGLVDEDGHIIKKASTPTLVERGYEPIINDMGKVSLQLLDECGYTLDDVKAVGVGVPGVTNSETGVIYFCTNLGWHHVPLRDVLQRQLPKPIYIENDATVAGLAEALAGSCKGHKSAVFLTLGTGVGGGVIIDGKVYTGAHHVGSELGHMCIKFDGDLCTCGNRGCWERYSSATALIRDGKAAYAENPDSLIGKLCEGDPEKITAKIVIDAAREGDPTACKVFDQYIYYLTMGIIAIINALDPEIIALGGGVSGAGDFLLEPLRKCVKEHIFYKDLPYADLVIATLGGDAGIIGAALLGK